MPRVKRAVNANKRHKKILKQAKGFRGRRNKIYRIAKQAIMKAGQYTYKDRKNKKRFFRSIWITKISAACKKINYKYNFFINKLKKNNIILNRKIISNIITNDKQLFFEILKKI
ncbi:50S ribosomal protein L20 [Candidatus Zinderia endosymbiont of Aphrophora alni]|uniref:50S ribosomal protein L20 n=1 Tax=Candidatus Zinderia endosymbiont of Aphrophora alni TaxID=3077951 RepID=UPI0030CD88E1